MRYLLLLFIIAAFDAAAQPVLSQGERPADFDAVQVPTERPAALLEALEVSYPDTAMQRQWEGVSIIAAWIDQAGYVAYAEVSESSGYRLLDSIALQSVLRGNFRAAQRREKRVSSRVSIPVEFRIRRDADNYDAVKSEEQLQQEAQELQRARQMLEEEQKKIDEEIRRLKQLQKKDTLQ